MSPIRSAAVLFTVLSVLFAETTAAQPTARSKAPSAELQRRLFNHNFRQAQLDSPVLDLSESLNSLGFPWSKKKKKNDVPRRPTQPSGQPVPSTLKLEAGTRRPFAEYEPAGSLFFSAETHFGSRDIKSALLRELPAGVEAVIYASSSLQAERTRDWVSSVAPNTRTTVITIPLGGQQFWTRDALPIPVLNALPSDGEDGAAEVSLEMVDAVYFHRFEPDEIIARGFGARLHRHKYYFEGGNFITDSRGNCFIVDYQYARTIPDTVFEEIYGCESLTRLPFVAGIGHADERVKILSEKLAVTDTPSYVAFLKSKGFEVRLLPQLYPAGRDRTYVNSLLINGTVYLPVFGQESDYEAIQVYKDAGFKVIPLYSGTLTDTGRGSIHCITMTYPPSEFRAQP